MPEGHIVGLRSAESFPADSTGTNGYTLSTSSPYIEKDMWIRVIIQITCILSMLGAILIVVSFACCKDLRSKGRQILVNISFMDFGVATFNFLGASFYLDHYYHSTPCSNCTTVHTASILFANTYRSCGLEPEDSSPVVMCPNFRAIPYLCLSQAALSLYFTYASILWTNTLCFYLYFRIVHSGSRAAWFSLCISYVFCYGMPLLLTLWLVLTGRLGYSPFESSGWCSIILLHPVTKTRDIYASIFGYNLWIVITLVFIPVLSCAVHINVRNQTKNTAVYRRSDKFMLALVSIDYKFILIPLAFVLLRVWAFIGDVIHVYFGKDHLGQGISSILIVLAGIGDSGQGITNSLIFLFFTKKFKDWVKGVCCRRAKVRDLHIQSPKENRSRDVIDNEDRSLLDSTSVENISPHQFTYHSFENATPSSLDGGM